jgi:hypothetical protein
MLGGPKIEGSPQSQESKQAHESHEEKGDKESPKACTLLKSSEPLYTCPQAPFYRETRGLLQSEIALES